MGFRKVTGSSGMYYSTKRTVEEREGERSRSEVSVTGEMRRSLCGRGRFESFGDEWR